MRCRGYADCTAEQRANGCSECLPSVQKATPQDQLADLQRQHDRLRSAAEPAKELLRLLSIQWKALHGVELMPLFERLDAALLNVEFEPER